MTTVFNLAGTFNHKTRKYIGALPVFKRETVILWEKLTLEDINRLGPEGLECEADKRAVKLSINSPFEKRWLEDWQLIPYKVEESVNV